MPISRRSLIAGAAALPLVNIGRAQAAEFSYKLAHDLPRDHPLNVRSVEACTRIREATGGKVEITVFPDSQLGSDIATLGKIRAGEVDFFSVPGLILSSLVPAASINGVGFAFKGYNQVWRAMDGKLGAFVSGEIGKFGIRTVGRVWNNGFRQSTSSVRPIQTPDDLRGLKLRVPASPLSTSLFTSLGAVPASLNLDLVYSALQRHDVDGQETPLALVQAVKLFEVQAYCSLTYHMWDGYWLLANEGVWRGLPDRLRDIVEHEFDRSGQDERDDLAKLDPNLRGDLAMMGLKFNSVDTAPFQQVLQRAGFYADWRGKYGEAAWSVLEEYSGALT